MRGTKSMLTSVAVSMAMAASYSDSPVEYEEQRLRKRMPKIKPGMVVNPESRQQSKASQQEAIQAAYDKRQRKRLKRLKDAGKLTPNT